MFTKISICLFLLRIVTRRDVVIGMYTLIGFLVVFTATCVFLFIGVCRPLKAYWDVGVSGTCLSDHQVEMVVISQGGKILPSYENVYSAYSDSSLSPHGSHMRFIAGNLLEKSADQYRDQSGALHPDGTGCNVRSRHEICCRKCANRTQYCHLLYRSYRFIWCTH